MKYRMVVEETVVYHIDVDTTEREEEELQEDGLDPLDPSIWDTDDQRISDQMGDSNVAAVEERQVRNIWRVDIGT